MTPHKLFRVGITGSVLTGVCCFTPLLVTTFSMFGVLTWLKWTDFVLFPMLGGFVVLTIYAIERLRRDYAPSESKSESPPST